jgi:hypothetical protein
LSGGEPATLIEATGQNSFVQPTSWSPDDRHLLFLRREASGGQADLYVWSFESKSATAFVATPRDEWVGLFSPDGKWVVYTSDEFNTTELSVTSFPSPGDRRRLATNVIPLSWGAGGREILGIDRSGRVIAIPITVGAAGVIGGAPTVLIDEPTTFGPRIAPIADHSRFLVGARPDPEKGVAEIRLIRGLLDRLRGDRSTGR